jgi:hypothetical protein
MFLVYEKKMVKFERNSERKKKEINKEREMAEVDEIDNK